MTSPSAGDRDQTTERQVRPGRLIVMLVADAFEHDPRIEKQAATLVQQGYDVTVLAWNRFGTSQSAEIRAQVRILRAGIPNPRGSGWWTVAKLPRLFWWFFQTARRLPYDTVVCHDMFTWPVGWALRALTGRRAVFDAHEPYAEQLVGILPGVHRVIGWLHAFEGFLARRADVLMTVTPALVKRYAEMGVEGVFYLPNVPSLAAFAPAARADRRGAGGPFIIGRVGGISPRYSGVEPLIEIGRELRGRGVNVRIVLGGPVMKGWDREFKALLSDAGSLVEYVGTVPYARLPNVTGSFDLVASLREGLLPETAYGISTKLLDAMALGIPVVSTRVGEDEELVSRTEAGILIGYPIDVRASADLIEQLIREPKEAARFGANGRRAVEQGLNWERYETDYCEVITGEYSSGR